jgi:hypothetical protein
MPQQSPIFGYTDFDFETRSEIVDKFFARCDTVFSNWLAGEYASYCSLEDAICDDPEARDLKDIHWCLYCHFTGDYDGKYYNYLEASDWLVEHMGMTQWPTRVSRVVPQFQSARTFSMHGPSGEVEHVPVVQYARPVAHVARRSTRVKKQREFYYGF